MVDVGKHSSSSEEGGVGLVEMDAEGSDEGEGGEGGVDGGAGRGSGSRGVDGRFGSESGKDGFEGFDHSVGLTITSQSLGSTRCGRKTNLAVNVLETTHNDSIEMLDRLDLFEVDLRLDDRLVDLLLVLESIDVFSGVRIDVLERFGEFVVQSIDETDDTTSHDDDRGRVIRRGSSFVGIVVIGRFFSNGVLTFLREIGEEDVEVRASGGPGFDRHVRLRRGVVIEEGGDEGEENSDSLIRRSGDGEESLQNLGLLSSIGVLSSQRGSVSCSTGRERRTHLSSTSFENLSERFEDPFRRDGDGLSFDTDGLEVVVLLLSLGGGIRSGGFLLGSFRGSGDGNVLSQSFSFERFRILLRSVSTTQERGERVN